MGLVEDLLDRFRVLQNDRQVWLSHWLDIARYVLPDAERFDQMFATVSGSNGIVDGRAALNSVVNEPIGARRSKEIYDTTSLWAVDRGAAGTLALVTPQSSTWHDLSADDPLGAEPSDEETRFYERLRDYLFKTRGNPRSGFWTAQKSALRCVWAFGTAVLYIEESDRGIGSPISYRYVPLSECHLGTDFEGNVNANFRLFQRSAQQCVEKWGTSCSAKTQQMAADPKRKDQLVTILHAIYQRDEKGSYSNTNRGSAFASCIVEVSERKLIGESGFYEFPYRVDHWQRNNPGPYSEGPIALALAEIKSLNMLAKQELLGVQQWVNPPIATMDDPPQRLNLNPRGVNPGYIDNQGRLLAQPIVTTQRPDFAQAVLEQRRTAIRETTYLNLWQTIIDSPRQQTAYEVMVKAAEKGDALGPVGTSLQVGLSFQVDREIAILGRKRAFEPGSALEAPQSVRGKNVAPEFTSPLDKMRRMPELQGMTQLASIVTQVEQVRPGTSDKIDWDVFVDEAAEILSVPRKVMTPPDVLESMRQSKQMQTNAATSIATAHAAGAAAEQGAIGAQALADSPAASAILQKLAIGGQLPAAA